jgi:hypothetical protein
LQAKGRKTIDSKYLYEWMCFAVKGEMNCSFPSVMIEAISDNLPQKGSDRLIEGKKRIFRLFISIEGRGRE